MSLFLWVNCPAVETPSCFLVTTATTHCAIGSYGYIRGDQMKPSVIPACSLLNRTKHNVYWLNQFTEIQFEFTVVQWCCWKVNVWFAIKLVLQVGIDAQFEFWGLCSLKLHTCYSVYVKTRTSSQFGQWSVIKRNNNICCAGLGSWAPVIGPWCN